MWKRVSRSLMKAKQMVDKETCLELGKSMSSTMRQLSSSGFTRLVIILELELTNPSFDPPNAT